MQGYCTTRSKTIQCVWMNEWHTCRIIVYVNSGCVCEVTFAQIDTPIARFTGSTWGPSGADKTQVGPMLAPWTLLGRTHIHTQHTTWNIRLNHFGRMVHLIDGLLTSYIFWMHAWLMACMANFDDITFHYSDVTMDAIASQITSLTIVYWTIHSGADQRKKIKALRHWPLCGEFNGDQWIPLTKASNAEKVSIYWRHHANCDCSIVVVPDSLKNSVLAQL